jgi:hypothetical protein
LGTALREQAGADGGENDFSTDVLPIFLAANQIRHWLSTHFLLQR